MPGNYDELGDRAPRESLEKEIALEKLKGVGQYDDDIEALRKLQNAILGYTTEKGESLPSLPYNSLNIKEIESADVEFVYNYFTKNERLDKNTYSINSGYLSSAEQDVQDLLFLTQNQKERLPMYNKITFDFPTHEAITMTAADFKNRGIAPRLDGPNGFLDKAISEDTLSNKVFTGIEFIDTLADTKIYHMLSSSIVFQNTDIVRNSLSQRTEAFLDEIGENQGFNPETKLNLVKILNNYQSEGVSKSSGDVGENELLNAVDPISRQSFSTKFNNLFFGDIVNFSLQTRNNVYTDEMLSLVADQNIAGNAQTSLVNSARTDGIVSTSEYEILVKPIHTRNLNANSGNILTFEDFTVSALENKLNYLKEEAKNYPNIKTMGILIQKFEVTNDGIIKKPGFFIEAGSSETEIIDRDIKYGAAYVYRIRKLCFVETIIEVTSSNSLIALKVGSYIVASSGKIVTADCTELVTPPPPHSLKAVIDYKKQKPTLIWEYPVNPQRDIKRFQIFKRRSINEPFVLVQEYNFDNTPVELRTSVKEVAISKNVSMLSFASTKYLDEDFDLKKDDAIYAIASVDAHGLSSGYSTQLRVRYDRFNNRLQTDVISRLGAPKPYPNLYIDQDFFEDAMKTSGYKRCNIFFDPEYYKVFQTDPEDPSSESDIELIKFTDKNETEPKNFPYVFNFINVDNQISQNIRFKIVDLTGPPQEIDPATLNIDNLSFELGIE